MWACRVGMSALLVGCGSDVRMGPPDAGVQNDDTGMGQLDAPAQYPCDYDEAADATNDTVNKAEATGLTLASRITLCGAIDTGHFAQQTVDADAYAITLGAQTDVLLHLTGAGIDGPDSTVFQIRQGGMFFGFSAVEGDHGTLAASLPAGEYVLALASFNDADLGAPVDYRLTLVTDMPGTRCAALTGGTPYTETNDGDGSGNDVIEYDAASNQPSSLTTSTTDNPEPTSIVAEPAMRYAVDGISADIDVADDYEDRDTYVFTTGTTTTQVSVRLDWVSTTMDLDFRIYPPTTGDPLSFAAALTDSQSGGEFQTFAVKPSTPYWLWIAAEDGATGQPSDYSATICGESFTP